MELFCTPKSSTENPSLRVNRYGGHKSRTFIAEDFIDDEFGQWATEEVTGEQCYVNDERSCFWTWDNNEYAWQSRPFKSQTLKNKVRAKEKAKVEQEEPEEHSLVKSNQRNQNCGLKKIVLGGPKENGAIKALQRAMKAFGKVDFALDHLKRVQAVISIYTNAEARTKKGKGKEGAYPQSGFSASENTVEEGQGYSW